MYQESSFLAIRYVTNNHYIYDSCFWTQLELLKQSKAELKQLQGTTIPSRYWLTKGFYWLAFFVNAGFAIQMQMLHLNGKCSFSQEKAAFDLL